MMTPQQIKLVQRSFKTVVPLRETVAELFYTRLFAIDPGLRRMFQGDMAAQGRKLMDMLTVAVDGLPRLEDLVPELQALGRRHVEYGVVPTQYKTVGDVLLWTLEKGLGEAFTPDVHDAWAKAYDVLAQTMISAAEHETA